MLGSLAVAAALALSTAPAVAATPAGHSDGSQRHRGYVCTGGEIASGTYDSITVTGTCAVAADAVIRVDGNVTVRMGATLDAQSAPSTILVKGNVTAAKGSLLGLGCQPDFTNKTGHPCTVEPTGHSTITVKGSIWASKAGTILLNGITVKGNVTLIGGGGPIPWSIKNSTIGGNLTISGLNTNWLGVLFNTVGRNVTLTNIALSDPDPGAPGVYVVRNTIRDNLVCFGLTPGVSGGFVPGEVNVVGHHAIGQCSSLV
jgi:hypothetical protein